MNKLTLLGVPLIWTNFAGREGRFNKEGERSFNVVIEDQGLAEELKRDGWNVKEIQPLDEDDPLRWFLRVKVNFDSQYPPRVFKVNEEGTRKTHLTESTIEVLDILRVRFADVQINPYEWTSPDGKNTGISAYLDTMYAVTEVNELDLKWEKIEAESLLEIESDNE